MRRSAIVIAGGCLICNFVLFRGGNNPGSYAATMVVIMIERLKRSQTSTRLPR